MPTPLHSLIRTGTKIWVDSVDPADVTESLTYGATGATSNPLLVAGLMQSGQYDEQLATLMSDSNDDEEVAWNMTDRIISDAQKQFAHIHEQTAGDDGYVSFELDPLLEAVDCPLSVEERTARYIELGKKWSEGHQNRMIKVPATPAGLASLEEMAALGITLNVTLLFTLRQYQQARDAIWRGAQRRGSLEGFKSVYSVFVSRVDVYTQKHLPNLSEGLQGQIAMVNAQLMWQDNTSFWADKGLDLKQELVFASTGVKDPNDPADKFNAGLAGSDIQTVPPETNRAIMGMEDKTYEPRIHQLPGSEILSKISDEIDFVQLEDVLMEDGLKKFADPQQALLKQIAEKRSALISAD